MSQISNNNNRESVLDKEDLAILKPLPQEDSNKNPVMIFLSSDKFFNFVVTLLVTIVVLLIAYPIYVVFIASISDPYSVSNGDVLLLPKGSNIDGFKRVFADPRILRSVFNSIIITTLGTSLSLICTMPVSYVLSIDDFKFNKVLLALVMITIYFSGGMIPEFLLMRGIGLYNTWWALILPGLVSSWNVIITRTFLKDNISGELLDAAKIDGANHWQFFTKVALPLSSTIMVIIGLFYGVGYWNAYSGAMIYIKDQGKYPFQLILRDILIRQQIAAESLRVEGDIDGNTMAKMNEIAMSVKYVVAVIAVLPIIIIFPLVEKYFVKGIMVGSIKG